jgi:hypothetical protein
MYLVTEVHLTYIIGYDHVISSKLVSRNVSFPIVQMKQNKFT